jgi:SAM-dependent methyltransferase
VTLHLFALATVLAAVCVAPAVSPAPDPEPQTPTPAPGAGQAHDGHDGHHGAAAHQHGGSETEVDVHRPGMKHDFSNVDELSQSFDSPERAAWQKPEEVIALLAIQPGMTVADIGAGTGFFEPFLARAVGGAGKVLALDVEPRMVERLSARARAEGLAQIEARLVAPDDPGLPPRSVDRILVVNTWHHIDDRGRYSAKLRDALAADGAIFIVDFDKSSAKGPPAQHKLEPREVVAELEAGGLAARQVEEDLPDQYVVVARSKP